LAGQARGKVAFALAAGSAETDRAAPGGNVGAERLAGLRQEAGRVLQAVDKALADTGQVLSPQQGRVLEKALAMLKATVRRDDPDQIVLAMDMVNEAARPVMETRMGTEPGRAMKGKAGQEP